MCLLDEVLSWDLQRISCRSASHRAADNPLRAHGRLGAACAIEYAAQTVAVHGALLQCPPASGSGFGMLTSARRVELRSRAWTIWRTICWSAPCACTATRSARCMRLHCTMRAPADGRLSLLHGAVAAAQRWRDRHVAPRP